MNRTCTFNVMIDNIGFSLEGSGGPCKTTITALCFVICQLLVGELKILVTLTLHNIFKYHLRRLEWSLVWSLVTGVVTCHWCSHLCGHLSLVWSFVWSLVTGVVT